jgi:hypothetical protein
MGARGELACRKRGNGLSRRWTGNFWSYGHGIAALVGAGYYVGRYGVSVTTGGMTVLLLGSLVLVAAPSQIYGTPNSAGSREPRDLRVPNYTLAAFELVAVILAIAAPPSQRWLAVAAAVICLLGVASVAARPTGTTGPCWLRAHICGTATAAVSLCMLFRGGGTVLQVAGLLVAAVVLSIKLWIDCFKALFLSIPFVQRWRLALPGRPKFGVLLRTAATSAVIAAGVGALELAYAVLLAACLHGLQMPLWMPSLRWIVRFCPPGFFLAWVVLIVPGQLIVTAILFTWVHSVIANRRARRRPR